MKFEDPSNPADQRASIDHDPAPTTDLVADPTINPHSAINPHCPPTIRRKNWLPRIEPSAIPRRELRVLRDSDGHPVVPNSMVASFLLHVVALAALFFIPVGSLLSLPRRGQAAENFRITVLPPSEAHPELAPNPAVLKTPHPVQPRRQRLVQVKVHTAAIQKPAIHPLKKQIRPRPPRDKTVRPPQPQPVMAAERPAPPDRPSDHQQPRRPSPESTLLAQNAPDPGAGGRPMIRRHRRIEIASRVDRTTEPLFEAPTEVAPPTLHDRHVNLNSESSGDSTRIPSDLAPAAPQRARVDAAAALKSIMADPTAPAPHKSRQVNPAAPIATDTAQSSNVAMLPESAESSVFDPVKTPEPPSGRHALHARMGKDKGWAGVIGLPGAGKPRQLSTHGAADGPAAMTDTTAPVSVHAGRQESAPSADLAVAEAAAVGDPSPLTESEVPASDQSAPAADAPKARRMEPIVSDAASAAAEIAGLPADFTPGADHARARGDSTFSPTRSGDSSQNRAPAEGRGEPRRSAGPAANDPVATSGDSNISEPLGGTTASDQDSVNGPEIGGSRAVPALGEGGEGEAPGRDVGSGFGGKLRSAVMDGSEPDLEGNYTIPGVITTSDYDWHINDLAKLLGEISDRTDVKVQLSQQYVMLGQEPIRHAPLLVFTGHRAFTLTEAQREALRQYVARGGMIWGDDSLTVFDQSFREEMIKTFGAEPETIPLGSPIYRSHYSLKKVPPGDFGQAHLFEGIPAPGNSGRLAVVITRNRYFACMDGPPYCTETTQRNAYRVGTNIFFYAVRHYQQANGA